MKVFRFYDSCCDYDCIQHVIILANNKDEAIKIAKENEFDYTDIFEYENKPQVIHEDYRHG